MDQDDSINSPLSYGGLGERSYLAQITQKDGLIKTRPVFFAGAILISYVWSFSGWPAQLLKWPFKKNLVLHISIKFAYTLYQLYFKLFTHILFSATSDYKQALQFQSLNDEKRNIQMEVCFQSLFILVSLWFYY